MMIGNGLSLVHYSFKENCSAMMLMDSFAHGLSLSIIQTPDRHVKTRFSPHEVFKVCISIAQ